MIYLLAILIPGLAMLLRGKLLLGILCLVLQWTVFGWIPATLWAFAIVANSDAERRVSELEKRLSNPQV